MYIIELNEDGSIKDISNITGNFKLIVPVIMNNDENDSPRKLQKNAETAAKSNETISPGSRQKASAENCTSSQSKKQNVGIKRRGRPPKSMSSNIKIHKVGNKEESFANHIYGGTKSSCDITPQLKKQKKNYLSGKPPRNKTLIIKKTKCIKSTKDDSPAKEFKKMNEKNHITHGTISQQPGPPGLQNIRKVRAKKSSTGTTDRRTKISDNTTVLQRKQKKCSGPRGWSKYKKPGTKPLLDEIQYPKSMNANLYNLRSGIKKIQNAYDDIEPKLNGDGSLNKCKC